MPFFRANCLQKLGGFEFAIRDIKVIQLNMI